MLRISIIAGAIIIGATMFCAVERKDNAISIQDTLDISVSAVHSDLPYGMEGIDEFQDRSVSGDDNGSDNAPVESDEFRITRESIIDYAINNYDVSYEWVVWLIGTTWNEDYHNDRYLEYCWACEILNVYQNWSVWDLDGIWGEYYSIEHAYSGFYNADDTCLEMVWLALTETDTRITEVDGMITYPPDNYYLIYDSDLYNCQVWGE